MGGSPLLLPTALTVKAPGVLSFYTNPNAIYLE